MPVMDGREAAKNIIIKHGKDHPLLIAMTALAFEEEKESILSSGIEEIVHKPLELSELTEKLKIWESRFQ
jgi:CheY-like chemotaxis protein